MQPVEGKILPLDFALSQSLFHELLSSGRFFTRFRQSNHAALALGVTRRRLGGLFGFLEQLFALLVGQRGQQHRHAPTFHRWFLLNFAEELHFVSETIHQPESEFLVGNFPAFKAAGDQDFVALRKEFGRALEAHVEVVGIGSRLDAHFLDLGLVGLLVRLFFLLAILVLAVIEDLANRRAFVGVDFNQIKPRRFRARNRLGGIDFANRFTIIIDEEDAWKTNLTIDAKVVFTALRNSAR